MGTKITVRRDAFKELSNGALDAIESATLEDLELLLQTATAAGFEAFVIQGLTLKTIRDKRKYRDAGFDTWEKYCKSGRAFGYQKRSVDQLISAAETRPLLPDLGASGAQNWTERTVRPLTSCKLSNPDKRRIGKKIATRIKKGERLTAKLVKSIVDDELGVERQKQKRMTAALEDAAIDKNLTKSRDVIRNYITAFSLYPEDHWAEAEEASPGLIKSLIEELDRFASFLKGVSDE